MIVKILGSASSNFHGVQYNDKKMEKGTGELMLMKNFPSFIKGDSSPEQVRDYFKSISKNEKVKKPQFHAVISAKYQNHGKEELTEFAKDFMQEMGYGKQPFIVVYHSDTENNHVHIVSTRVDKQTGKKINDSYERLKAQKALSDLLEKRYGISSEEKLKKLLNYQISSFSQLELLLERSGFKLTKDTNDENDFSILKNGVKLKTINGSQISFTPNSDNDRKRQLKAILSKYKDLCSNKVFKVEDRRVQESMLPEERHMEHWKPKIEFESELQKKLRDIFGLDVFFHHKDGQSPFGYSIIDHKSEKVFKGSEIMKMNELFELTDDKIDKKLFESLKGL
jgi:Relaxase/Mobilisation nuclease domain.